MPDDNCIADISLRFGEFCTKNGGVIAQRIGPFLPARLFFGCALEMAWRRGAGPWGHCSRHGGLQNISALQNGKSFVWSMRDPIWDATNQALLRKRGRVVYLQGRNRPSKGANLVFLWCRLNFCTGQIDIWSIFGPNRRIMWENRDTFGSLQHHMGLLFYSDADWMQPSRPIIPLTTQPQLVIILIF